MIAAVQQIVFTHQPQRWHALAAALGLQAPYPPSPEWGEFHGDGVLAVHHAAAEHPAGSVELNLLVDDLDEAARSLAGFDITRGEMDGVGEMLAVRASSGLEVRIFRGAPEAVNGGLAVQPIWFQDDVAEARAILEALGLQASIVSDGGGWVEMRAAGGGCVGVHAAATRSEGEGQGFGLSFEARGDLDGLAARLEDAGFEASVIDESYGRTIRIADPDVWINGAQDDLYGYHRED
ncbi:VOC family protein [Microbacterium esteraromaticum]|uniref:VOC family protein n=1 Tax=Microbacterium esteraromaticum TaxID=57043 RepID=A0A7D8AKX8_9MICO|nr:VOC family protein [Microbacterium esteraromaticum]QMU98385.1 VOC family protein [Microbacterium esteraromaticum]